MRRRDKILLLFDIDGTLISTNGMAGRLMLKALEEEVRQPIQYELKVFVGSTDRLIIKKFIEKTGVKFGDLESAIDRVLNRYLNYLAEKMNSPNHVKILPGVSELLNELAIDDNFSMGLVTGNIKEGAYSKLRLANLHVFFPVGAFGDDDVDRSKLPPIAVRRAEGFYKTKFSSQKVWIIGDSPKDIICAKANDLRSMAIASGWHTSDELLPYQPDIALQNLCDTKQVIRIFQDSSV